MEFDTVEYVPTPDDANFKRNQLGELYHDVPSHRVLLMRIPPRYRNLNPKTASTQLPGIEFAQAEVNDYTDNLSEEFADGLGLYLYSQGMGQGKTSLMAFALIQTQHLKHRPNNSEGVYSGHFIKFDALCNYFKIKYEKLEGSQKSVKFLLENVDFLAIDEVKLSGTKPDEENKDILAALLRHRSDHMKPTFITSNYTPEQFDKVFGEECKSFLDYDMHQINVDAKNYRKEKGRLLNPRKAKSA